MAVDLATAQTYLDTWTAAQVGLASNESYTLTFPNGTSRTVTRTDEQTIRNQIAYWHRVIQALDANARGASQKQFTTPRWT